MIIAESFHHTFRTFAMNDGSSLYPSFETNIG